MVELHFLALGPELTVLTQEQASYIDVKVQPRVLSFLMHSSQYSDGENRRGSRSGRTLHRSSSSAGPRHESSIAKNYFEIELDREELFAIELDMD